MRYQLSQKLIGAGGDYSARDESGQQVYFFDGKVFNVGGKKVDVLDAQKKQIAQIAKQLFTFGPSYQIKRNGQIAATIRKRLLTFRDQFVIDVAGTNDYRVVGDYIGHEYSITRGGKDVARVSKKFFGATDSYGVEIHGGDPLLILSTVVVIDMLSFKKLKSY